MLFRKTGKLWKIDEKALEHTSQGILGMDHVASPVETW